MNNVVQFKNNIIRKSLCMAGIVCLALYLFADIRWIGGFGLGCVISMVNFHLLSLDISKMTSLGHTQFRSLLIIRFFLRYGMIGLAIYVAFLHNLNIILFTVGLFMIQIMIIFDTFRGRQTV